MEALREWETQLCGKYDVIGRLLAPGETPRDYDDPDEGNGGDNTNDGQGDHLKTS